MGAIGKDPFDAFYVVTVEVAVSPLLLTETFYVKGYSDVERIRDAGSKYGYAVKSARVVHREGSDDVIAAIRKMKTEI